MVQGAGQVRLYMYTAGSPSTSYPLISTSNTINNTCSCCNKCLGGGGGGWLFNLPGDTEVINCVLV